MIRQFNFISPKSNLQNYLTPRYKFTSYNFSDICFSILILWIVCGKSMRSGEREGGTENIVSLIFFLWRSFNRLWERGCGLKQKVLFSTSWNRIFFQPWFKPTQLAWFILGFCIDWIFLHFIFMSHCCFRFPSLGNS